MKLKGEMSMLNVLHLQELDIDKIVGELRQKRDVAPQFFTQSPVIVDAQELTENAESFDFANLRENLLELGFIPVGVRNHPAKMNAKISEAGWAVMRENRNPIPRDKKKPEDQTAKTETNPVAEEAGVSEKVQVAEAAEVKVEEVVQQAPATPAQPKTLTIERPVRSGQQIYAANSDVAILAPTSAGSEIMADGSIHVYGALRGRVLAGAKGNENARIFCQSLQAELIAIAGCYQLLDESDTSLKGKPAMIRLEGEKLIIEPLGV